MASLRRVSYLLIILFFLDVSFIDHVATQCGVYWRPAGEDWANTWDGMLLFSCPKGKSIRRIHSIHRNCIEDRIWAFSCESNSAAQVCSWTGFVNSYDDLLNFKCPNNGFISGIYSVHSNKREDRRFEFKCCHSSSYSRHSCKWSHTTNWDADIDYSTTWGWLAGAHSYHNNHYEDRRWQFYQCTKSLLDQ